LAAQVERLRQALAHQERLLMEERAARLSEQETMAARLETALQAMPAQGAQPLVSEPLIGDDTPLSQEQATMQGAAVEALDGATPKSKSSRRDLLKWSGAAAAAATAGVVALSHPDPAHAASAVPAPTGGDFILGQANDADAQTSLTVTNG
jgi:hypothetical protein